MCSQFAAERGLSDAGPYTDAGFIDGLAFLVRNVPGVTVVGSRRWPTAALAPPHRRPFQDGLRRGLARGGVRIRAHAGACRARLKCRVPSTRASHSPR
jgi:hypothetical protein